MTPRVIEPRHVAQYVVWLKFSDGTEGEVDLKGELWGPVFEPLRDVAQFAKFSVHPELHTIVWQKGADFSPEFLYSALRPLNKRTHAS